MPQFSKTELDIQAMKAEIERLRAALEEIRNPTKWSEIKMDSDEAIRGALIVSDMQRIAREALMSRK